MMTLLLAFKALRQRKILPTTMIKISHRAASQRPSVLGLKVGESINVRNAILALVVKSANDIAVALAECVGKTEKDFVAMMNQEARRLGMSSSTFFNASGWKDPRQLTTARDISKLARALVREYPDYYHFFANKQFYIENRCVKGHYTLLGKRGDIVVDGIKTGFVNASGFNLAASAIKGKTRLISVVLGGRTSKERDALTDLLLRKGFSRALSREMIAKSEPTKTFPRREQRKIASLCEKPTGIYNKMNELPKNSEVKNEQSASNAVR
jgi:D-alanyl-D-alanine carboxypeptidase